MKTQIVLALSIMVIIFIITGCEKTTGIENTTQNTLDYSVGEAHNLVLESLCQRKDPLINADGLIGYQDLVTVFSDIRNNMVALGYDSSLCDAAVQMALSDINGMGMIVEIDNMQFSDMNNNDMTMSTWNYMIANKLLDQGTIDKMSPIINIYEQKGPGSELNAAVAELNEGLGMYDEDTIIKILTFKDVYDHSVEYWDLYDITSPHSPYIMDAIGGLIGLVDPSGVTSIVIGVGWSYLHSRFVAWVASHH
ncbi:MAG: hypothetical protein PHN58_02845 [Candidatus Cloacimonetes bacterium]|jgi:hypothetical protein|nr:hypothetical protein [Candidatus Cloacimonas sp.]MDD2250748.1 hypothetical protein [Candidatus Cloacimonadota bacterium]OQC18375.1 MAG: hypothetical protein BWX72_00058 [Firmicutes bacterium ADurb.Bin080]MCK9165241.1 hypothetical protein [Candidatus Cloacimonas sp.]MDD3869365.1 hypothetical protein [Candidatus Cloacimonadota bacterium]